MTEPTLRGMATVSFWADDVKAARAWYHELLGIDPYFERPDSDNPAYVEFRLGDLQAELGIIDRRYASEHHGSGPGGAVLYWHVDDVDVVLARVMSMGGHGTLARDQTGGRIHHGFGRRSLRQHSWLDVQPALP